MKHIKLLTILGIFSAGFTIQSNAQELPAVTVLARNYKYLKSTDAQAAQPVRLLEHKAAAYDVKNSEYYEDDFDTYSIRFFLPSGYLLATYDSTGKLLSTAERFRDVALPQPVRSAVTKRFPGWAISKDVYRVQYQDNRESRMVYKIMLQNGNKRLRVKTNESGEFLD
jgi:hypothetical protein